ncbi:hypothetical protein ATCC90586_002746 [Pythium insidiosum]|nr:hypothetical protein ATCC90586_002746 [Pythium insidiosum]
MTVVPPVAIFISYARAFDPTIRDFPILYYYEDAWFTNAVAENQQVFVTSSLDLVSKYLPPFLEFFNLLTIRHLFLKQTQGASRPDKPQQQLSEQPTSLRPLAVSRVWSLPNLVQSLLTAIGVFVIVVHVHTTSVAWFGSKKGCHLSIRPWFASMYSCAVLEINCAMSHHEGQQDAIHQELLGFEPTSLQALIISSCPRLEVPPRLQIFRELQMLKIYNSTIVHWKSDAALSKTTHPSIQLLYMVYTNFTSFPDGLLSDEFPPTLQDIEFAATNLSSLPPIVKQQWKSIQYFVFERNAHVTTIPPAILDLQVPQLSLCANQIVDIPDALLRDQAFQTLSLAGNPLRRLPDDLGDLRQLRTIRRVATTAAVDFRAQRMGRACGNDLHGFLPCPSGEYCQRVTAFHYVCKREDPRCRPLLAVRLLGDELIEGGARKWRGMVCSMGPCCEHCARLSACVAVNLELADRATQLCRCVPLSAVRGQTQDHRVVSSLIDRQPKCTTPRDSVCALSDATPLRCCPDGQRCLQVLYERYQCVDPPPVCNDMLDAASTSQSALEHVSNVTRAECCELCADTQGNQSTFECVQRPPQCMLQYPMTELDARDIQVISGGNATDCCDACRRNPSCRAYTFYASDSDSDSDERASCRLKADRRASRLKHPTAVTGYLNAMFT